MQRGSSRTAALVTLYRAIESSRRPAMRLFDDPFAPLFLEWRFRTALRLSRLPVIGAAMPWSLIDGHWSGPRGTVAVRTKYIDDCLLDALRHGAKQVVILGAGFDCRAYRIPEITPTIPWPPSVAPASLTLSASSPPRYLAARNLALVEDVGADTYRERYLTPRGRGAEPLSEYQRAALAKVGASS